MPQLTKISPASPDAVQIWGFYGPCSVIDVAAALKEIGQSLTGDGYVIHIMSGTHGCCEGMIGAVVDSERSFAQEDARLPKPSTRDGKKIASNVVSFNNQACVNSLDKVGIALSLLNQSIASLAKQNPKQQIFLLAYCCSAGEESRQKLKY